MPIIYTDNTFCQYSRNPFDGNNPYSQDWILFKLIDKADDFHHLTTGGGNQVFRCIMTKEQKDWTYRINDFIQYESLYGKNIIIAINDSDIADAKADYGEHSYDDPFLRSYEPKVLVHSTTKENYKRIVSSGELKCWYTLRHENTDWENKPIGAVLGDPANYSEYIMFGTGGYYQEIIPLSKQKGRIDMDIDGQYIAGARLYFSADSIAGKGLLIRDGVHVKVKGRLPLDPYLFWASTPTTLGICETTTPRIFAELSDRFFTEMFGIPLEETCY